MIDRIIKKKFVSFFTIVIIFTIAKFSSANFGCWQFYDDYKILLSSSPLAPYEGQTASMLFSIIKDNKLIEGNLPGKIIFLKNDKEKGKLNRVQFENGIVSVKPNFNDPGFYEIRVEVFVDNTTITTDFPYEVKKRSDTNTHYSIISLFIVFLMGILLGFSYGKFNKKKKR